MAQAFIEPRRTSRSLPGLKAPPTSPSSVRKASSVPATSQAESRSSGTHPLSPEALWAHQLKPPGSVFAGFDKGYGASLVATPVAPKTPTRLPKLSQQMPQPAQLPTLYKKVTAAASSWAEKMKVAQVFLRFLSFAGPRKAKRPTTTSVDLAESSPPGRSCGPFNTPQPSAAIPPAERPDVADTSPISVSAVTSSSAGRSQDETTEGKVYLKSAATSAPKAPSFFRRIFRATTPVEKEGSSSESPEATTDCSASGSELSSTEGYSFNRRKDETMLARESGVDKGKMLSNTTAFALSTLFFIVAITFLLLFSGLGAARGSAEDVTTKHEDLEEILTIAPGEAVGGIGRVPQPAHLETPRPAAEQPEDGNRVVVPLLGESTAATDEVDDLVRSDGVVEKRLSTVPTSTAGGNLSGVENALPRHD